MSGDIRGGSDKRIIADLANLHHIVRHQTMASADKLQSRLALSDTTFAHDQHTFAVDIHQHAVNGNTRRQLLAEPPNGAGDKIRSGHGSDQNRHTGSLCHIQHSIARLQPPAKYDTRNLALKNLLVNRFHMFFVKLLQIGVFHLSDHLDTF